jgi:hypothetical protein
MDDTFRYLLQSARLISSKRASEEDIEFVKDLILSLENDEIISYYNTNTVTSIGSDFNLYVKLITYLIKYYEETEEYEKCEELKKKLNNSNEITKQKMI